MQTLVQIIQSGLIQTQLEIKMARTFRNIPYSQHRIAKRNNSHKADVRYGARVPDSWADLPAIGWKEVNNMPESKPAKFLHRRK